jgi:hypothetical protein
MKVKVSPLLFWCQDRVRVSDMIIKQSPALLQLECVYIECGSFSSIVSGGEIYSLPTGEEFTRLFQESEMRRYTSLYYIAPR